MAVNDDNEIFYFQYRRYGRDGDVYERQTPSSASPLRALRQELHPVARPQVSHAVGSRNLGSGEKVVAF